MYNSNSGIKQWPLAGALSEVHGKQIIGPGTVMYACEADGLGGWRSVDARPAFTHSVRADGEGDLHVYSRDEVTGKETRWF